MSSLLKPSYAINSMHVTPSILPHWNLSLLNKLIDRAVDKIFGSISVICLYILL